MPKKHHVFSRMKKVVASESLNLIASRKAMEGEDLLETGMNEGETEKHGFSAAGFKRVCRPHPFALEVQEGG